ncbi:MAG TPA: hypothetical protein VMV13_12930 [Candidatus Binataceae bacterium]|nr:hypothetical protein [Candidatus Binataceae bacterium]
MVGKLQIFWRESMIEWFLAAGFGNNAFYQMNLDGRIDNPDQRIKEPPVSTATGSA